MDMTEKEQVLRWLEAWERASKFLEEERRVRLRAMTDDDVRQAVLDLLSIPYPDIPDRGSGLVEQQKIFSRAR